MVQEIVLWILLPIVRISLKTYKNSRKSAQLLRSLIKNLDAVIPPVEKEWAVHTYCKYCFGVKVDEMKVTTDQMAAAMRSEGMAAHAGYLSKPIYRYDLLKRTFENSEYPYNISRFGGKIDYKEGLCPTAEKVCRKTIYCSWNENYSAENVNDIANAIGKVLGHYHK